MTGVMGLNILGQYVSDQPGLIAYMKQLNPAAFLVMDAPGLFHSIRQVVPNALAIYRAYHDKDKEVFAHWTPAQWLHDFGGLAQGGYVQVGNEPHGYVNVNEQVQWFAELARLARAANIRLALCAYGVGHPGELSIEQGAFDPLIKELADGYHLLLLHEYAKDSMIAERPHHIGRFQCWRDRARSLGVAEPRIVMGETGRDNVGPNTGGGERDGWRHTGWSEEQYAAFLRGAAPLYAAANIPALIFCYGRGAGGGWWSFDIQDANTLLEDLVSMNGVFTVTTQAAQQIEPKPADAGVAIRARVVSGLTLNVRRARSTNNATNPPVKTIYGGQEVLWYPGTNDGETRDGWLWAWVEGAAGGAWVACVRKSAQGTYDFTAQFLPIRAVTPLPLCIPVDFSHVISGVFNEPRTYPGYSTPQKHEGIDYAPVGACAPGKFKIVAAAAGTVIEVRDWKYLISPAAAAAKRGLTQGYGLTVVLQHEIDGFVYRTWYAHLSAPSVCVGDSVEAGDEIGVLGTSGHSTGLHLHFAVQCIGHGLSGYVLSDVIDPTPFLGL